jgi:hypothetical protein
MAIRRWIVKASIRNQLVRKKIRYLPWTRVTFPSTPRFVPWTRLDTHRLGANSIDDWPTNILRITGNHDTIGQATLQLQRKLAIKFLLLISYTTYSFCSISYCLVTRPMKKIWMVSVPSPVDPLDSLGLPHIMDTNKSWSNCILSTYIFCALYASTDAANLDIPIHRGWMMTSSKLCGQAHG